MRKRVGGEEWSKKVEERERGKESERKRRRGVEKGEKTRRGREEKGGEDSRGQETKEWRREESRWKRTRGGEILSISVLLLCVCTGMTAAN